MSKNVSKEVSKEVATKVININIMNKNFVHGLSDDDIKLNFVSMDNIGHIADYNKAVLVREMKTRYPKLSSRDLATKVGSKSHSDITRYTQALALWESKFSDCDIESQFKSSNLSVMADSKDPSKFDDAFKNTRNKKALLDKTRDELHAIKSGKATTSNATTKEEKVTILGTTTIEGIGEINIFSDGTWKKVEK